jgi:hypothetical protein
MRLSAIATVLAGTPLVYGHGKHHDKEPIDIEMLQQKWGTDVC